MKILLVEDDPEVRNTTIHLLENLGCTVVAVAGAFEAISSFNEQSNSIDLVLTDYSMPDINGIELAMNLKRIKPDIPIILCTGIHTSTDLKDISGSGVSEILSKPYSKTELNLALQRAAEK